MTRAHSFRQFRADRVLLAILLLTAQRCLPAESLASPSAPSKSTLPAKLYWFIPDGMRADPGVFDVYRWASEGKMPNLKRLMNSGTFGYSRPAFPGHTPANFATLFTGAYPEVNGVNDGPMHTQGSPLSQISVPGFSSIAKKVEPFWLTVEKATRADITLLSLPGSTPPELRHGITIRGRWGRWGADFHAVNFQDDADPDYAQHDRTSAKLFYLGAPLTQRIRKEPVSQGWSGILSHSPKLEISCTAWGNTLWGCISDSSDDQKVNYDRLTLSSDRATPLCTLTSGAWSDWLPVTLKWQIPNSTLQREVPTSVRIKLIRLEPNGLFRLRFFYNNINQFLTEPPEIADELTKQVGPMVDFVDNFPAQLIYYTEDKQTFLEESRMSMQWHQTASEFILRHYQPQVFIQNIYTPNQMLCSRWWMGYLDPKSRRYNQVTEAQRAQLWNEVQEMYRGLDRILGRLLDKAETETNTYVVLSSDHGAIPLDVSVKLNNLFAKKGWLKFVTDPKTQERVVQWEQTKVIYLKMHNVFIHPDGLSGNWKRGAGPAYEKLRSEVKRALQDLTDDQGVQPLVKVANWEDAGASFRLDSERTGDLIIANRPGYGWAEEMTPDLDVFSTPLVCGYKQAVLSAQEPGMWTPFVMAGPGVRKNHSLGTQPIEAVDQYPTLFRCLGLPTPPWVQGRVVTEAFAP
ncbi:MAG: alkaline phosphatase family protein [Verrucomicrobiales bacterium]|nr:alkaline phosphatase family protein [Verrucomicrobiales bacterium]